MKKCRYQVTMIPFCHLLTIKVCFFYKFCFLHRTNDRPIDNFFALLTLNKHMHCFYWMNSGALFWYKYVIDIPWSLNPAQSSFTHQNFYRNNANAFAIVGCQKLDCVFYIASICEIVYWDWIHYLKNIKHVNKWK